METTSATKTICVVLDTNIWRSERLLNSPKAQSLVYHIARRKGVLALPEIVEKELPYVIKRAGIDAASKLKQLDVELNQYLGKDSSAQSYGESDFALAVDERLSALESILHRIPSTIEVVRAALERVYSKTSPNRSQEQFRDSVIWETVVGLAGSRRVIFVTSDKQFYDTGEDRTKKLASDLAAEVGEAEYALDVYSDVGRCLDDLDTDRPLVDEARVSHLVIQAVGSALEKEVAQHGMTDVGFLEAKIASYALPDPTSIAIDFEVRTTCMLVSRTHLIESQEYVAIVFGGCYYNTASDEVNSVFIEKIVCKHESDLGKYYRARYFDKNARPTPIVRPGFHEV